MGNQGQHAVDDRRQVFENIFWPAVAGNVFWSFCNLSIDPKPSEIDFWPRLILLLIIAVYLTVGWLRLKKEPIGIDPRYWTYEFGHLVALAFSAIAAHVKPSILGFCLLAYFIWMTLGHWRNAWKLSDQNYPKIRLILIHFIGLSILLLGIFGVTFFKFLGVHLPESFFGGKFFWEPWAVPGSFIVTFLLWVAVRWKGLARIFSLIRLSF